MHQFAAALKPLGRLLHSFWLVICVLAWAALGALAPWNEPASANVPQDGGSFPAGPIGSQNGAGTLHILPNPAYVDVGGTVTVYVWLENAENYYGLDFRFTFDKNRVSIPTNKVSPLWEVFDEDNHFIIRNVVDSVDSTYNRLWYAVTNVSPAEPFTGTGRLGAITFQGLSEGTTVLHFIYAQGGTKNGDPLNPITVDGSIIVLGPSPTPTETATPTATHTPTLTPTPTATPVLRNKFIYMPLMFKLKTVTFFTP